MKRKSDALSDDDDTGDDSLIDFVSDVDDDGGQSGGALFHFNFERSGFPSRWKNVVFSKFKRNTRTFIQ